LPKNEAGNISSIETGLAKKNVMLPNGWKLTPAGRSLELGDLPLNIAVSSSVRLLAVTNALPHPWNGINGAGRSAGISIKFSI
jgi:hypothetical protein